MRKSWADVPFLQVQPVRKEYYADKFLQNFAVKNLDELSPENWEAFHRTVVVPNTTPERKHEVGKRGQAYLVDEAARLIAHPDISQVLRMTDMSGLAQVRAARAAELKGSPDQPLQGVDIRGRNVLSAYAEVTPPGWLVFAELPIDEAYAPLYDSGSSSITTTSLLARGAFM